MDQTQEHQIVLPGQLIGVIGTYKTGQLEDHIQYQAGIETRQKNAYSKIAGQLGVANDQNKLIISVVNPSISKSVQLNIGDVVVGKVLRIREDQAIIQVLLVDQTLVRNHLEGVIRKQNIRDFQIDSLQMQNCFLPGDIVKAKLISLGDSHKLYFGTEDDSLGVMFARHCLTKNLMLPFSWEEMICLKSGLKEFRKVAKPDMSLYSKTNNAKLTVM